MKKRLISILLALCMVLALVPGTAGASIDDASYSYKTTITTSNVTVGRDNYSCDVSMTTGEIMPHICKVVDNRLQKFAVLHDGDTITVYPNKYGTTSNGKYIYVDASVGSGYVYEKYIVFKDENPPTTSDSELPAPVISLTTDNSIQAGSSSGVRWNPVKGAAYYLYNILDVDNQIYSQLDAICYGTETENLLWSTPGTYNIWVQAVDSNGNRSEKSNVVLLTVTGQGSTEPDTPSKPPVVNPPVQPDTPSKPGTSDPSMPMDSSKLELIKVITQKALSSASEAKKAEIYQKIYDVLFNAEFRPDYINKNTQSKLAEIRRNHTIDTNFGSSNQLSVNKGWPAPNGGGLKTSILDNILGSIDIYESKGCLAYGMFVSKYVMGSCGSKTYHGTSAADLKKLIQNNATPGECIRILKDAKSYHAVAYLGEYDDGFFCVDYGESDPRYGIGFKYWTYEGFVQRYKNGDFFLYDTDNGSYYGKAEGQINCPVDASISLGSETLNSTPLKDGETCTTSFGSMTRNGEGIDFSIDYRTDYDFQIWGTGNGTMTLTLNYYSGTELRNTQRFVSVPITSTTRITTSSFNMSGEFSLRVDSDEITGTVWNAGVNETVTAPDAPPAPGSYYIHTPVTQNGTIAVTKRTAAPGDWVNIYTTPDKGYRLDSLTVTDHRGWPVTAREMGENTFSFNMPVARVTVNVVFTKVEEEVPFPTEDSTTTGPDTVAASPSYVDVILNPSPMNFTDVSAADWFYNDVRFCWQHYLMTGVSDTQFDPQGTTNRATIWTVIARLAGRDTSGGSIWYERGQIWAKNKGITDGADPLADVTREQLVTMLWRYNGNKYVQADNLSRFNDSASVSWWAAEAVNWAVAAGIINGANGGLNPQGSATRAEVASILSRFCQFAG